MLYSILLATLVYLNNGQFDLTANPCDSLDDSNCQTLQGTYGALLGLAGLSGESFQCGEAMGFCTVTCNNPGSCNTVNNGGYGITTSQCQDEGGVMKCLIETGCTTSADCVNAALPRCDNPNGGANGGTCVTQSGAPTGTPTTTAPTTAMPTGAPTTAMPTGNPTTAMPTGNPTTAAPATTPATDEPTNAPVTSQPTGAPTTSAPTTSMPTDAPTTLEDVRAACVAACSSATAREMHCESTDPLVQIACEDVNSECEAQCLVDYQYAVLTKDLSPQELAFVNTQLPPDLVAAYCEDGSCSDTDAPTTSMPTNAPTTSSPTTAEPTVPEDKTAAPTTVAPTTADPTAYPTTAEFDACLDACSGEKDIAMFCEGEDEPVPNYPKISIDCTEVDNKCEAQCLVDAKKAELTKDLSPSDKATVDALLPSLYPAGIVNTFCFNGTCPTPQPTDSPNTAIDALTTTDFSEDPSSTDMTSTDMATTEDPCDDPYYDYDGDCPVETGDGCSLQFNVTLDLCILNRKFRRNAIWQYVKEAYLDALSLVAGFEDCLVADVKIMRFRPGFKTPQARLRGQRNPKRKRRANDTDESCGGDPYDPNNECCEDLDDVCGVNRGEKLFTLDIDAGFYCGNCNTLKSVVTTVKNNLDDFDAKFILKCLGVSVEGDEDLCASGFGDVQLEINDAILAYVNADGVVEESVGTGDGNSIKYGFALMFGFILAVIN